MSTGTTDVVTPPSVVKARQAGVPTYWDNIVEKFQQCDCGSPQIGVLECDDDGLDTWTLYCERCLTDLITFDYWDVPDVARVLLVLLQRPSDSATDQPLDGAGGDHV